MPESRLNNLTSHTISKAWILACARTTALRAVSSKANAPVRSDRVSTCASLPQRLSWEGSRSSGSKGRQAPVGVTDSGHEKPENPGWTDHPARLAREYGTGPNPRGSFLLTRVRGDPGSKSPASYRADKRPAGRVGTRNRPVEKLADLYSRRVSTRPGLPLPRPGRQEGSYSITDGLRPVRTQGHVRRWASFSTLCRVCGLVSQVKTGLEVAFCPQIDYGTPALYAPAGTVSQAERVNSHDRFRTSRAGAGADPARL